MTRTLPQDSLPALSLARISRSYSPVRSKEISSRVTPSRRKKVCTWVSTSITPSTTSSTLQAVSTAR